MDAVPYGTAGDSCPPVPLPPAVDAGLSSCLLEGRLTSDGHPVETSIFDADALRVVEYALARPGSVLICPADPLSPLSALIAAAVHVDAMVRIRLASGRAEPSPLRVGVVTGDYHGRGFYRGLAVRERRGVGGVPMRSIVPAATIGANGMLSVIDRDDGHWSTVFVESVEAARRLPNLDLLIADLPVPDAERLTVLNIPTVVVARDPADPVALRIAERTAAFGYDWAIRGGVAPDGFVANGSAARIANRAGGRVRIVPVIAPTLCTDAGLFWDDIGTLRRLGGRSPFVDRLIADAFGLFHDLVGLAMPVGDYEQMYGRTLQSRVEVLARNAKIVANRELRDDWLPMVEAELAGMLGALRAAERRDSGDLGYATKAAVLPGVLAEALDDGKDVLVVTRTAPLARVYAEYLSTRWSAVRVASLGELTNVPPADTAVLLGIAPRWGRWVYRSGVGRELAVLAYSAPGPSGPASTDASERGFDEAALAATAVTMQLDAGLGLSTPEQRARACAAVRSGRAGDGGYRHRPSDVSARGVGMDPPRPPEVPPGLWDGGGWTAVIERESTTGSAAQTEADGSEFAPGLRVVFTDGSWAWLQEHSLVWRWRRHSGRTDPVEARRLTVGDDLVFIDGDAHKTLLAKVLEVASEIPELAVASTWIDYWRSALARAHTQCGSYAALDRALAVLGCTVQSQTVRLWCIGATIGPDDPEDVRRLGELLYDQILKTRSAQVWQAMQTLRHAHGRLGIRLAGLARSLGAAARGGHLSADEVLDEASGLTAADIESAVVVVGVTEIERVDAVPRVLTGRRRGPDEPVDLIRTDPDEEQQ